MAIIEDFDSLAKDYLTPKNDSASGNDAPRHDETVLSDSDVEDIIVVSQEGMKTTDLMFGDKSEEEWIVPDSTDVIIEEPPLGGMILPDEVLGGDIEILPEDYETMPGNEYIGEEDNLW